MGAYPTSPREAFLAWCQDHTEVFTTQASNIGLTPAEATLFVNTVTDATASNVGQRQAQDAARIATEANNDQFTTLRAVVGNTVRSIKAFAETQNKPSEVYTLAQIPQPSPPTPMPPPGQPTNLTVTIAPGSGQLTLKWKCENPAGSSNTTYLIRRKLPTDATFFVIGASGTKEFVDTTFVAGPDSVIYTIQAQRGSSVGDMSDWFVINFGSQTGGGGGGFTTSVMPQGRVNAADAALVDAIVNSKANTNGGMVMNGHAMANGKSGRKGGRG